MKYLKMNLKVNSAFLFLYPDVPDVPPFPQQDTHWGTVCAGNPINEIRGCDNYGCGYYGAPRYL